LVHRRENQSPIDEFRPDLAALFRYLLIGRLFLWRPHVRQCYPQKLRSCATPHKSDNSRASTGPLTLSIGLGPGTLPGLTPALTGRRNATAGVDFEVSRIEIAGRPPSPPLVWLIQQLFLWNGRWYMLTKREGKPCLAHNSFSRLNLDFKPQHTRPRV